MGIRRWLRGTFRADRFEADEVDAGSVNTDSLQDGEGRPDDRWVVRETFDATDLSSESPIDVSDVDEMRMRWVGARGDPNNAQYGIRVKFEGDSSFYDSADYNYRQENASVTTGDDEWELIDDSGGGEAVNMDLHFYVGPDTVPTVWADMAYFQSNAKSLREGWMDSNEVEGPVDELQFNISNNPATGIIEVQVPV